MIVVYGLKEVNVGENCNQEESIAFICRLLKTGDLVNAKKVFDGCIFLCCEYVYGI